MAADLELPVSRADTISSSSVINRANSKKLFFSGICSFSILLLLMGLNAAVGVDINITVLGIKLGGFLLVLGSGLWLGSLLMFVAAYLEIFAEDTGPISSAKAIPDDIKLRLAALEESVRAQGGGKDVEQAVEEIFHRQIAGTVRERISGSISTVVEESILERYGPAVEKNNSLRQIRMFFRQSISGIQNQLVKQQRAANTNVIIGMMFAAAGLSVMGYVLWEAYIRPNALLPTDWTSFMFGFVPKITFVVLFESIAFFFLQAYRDDRGMVRYLRNELTNVESKTLGMLVSVLFGDKDDIKLAAKVLLATERNITIKKGERIILEAFQTEHPLLFDRIIERLTPNLGSSGPKT